MTDVEPALDLERFLPYRLSVLTNGISRRLAGLYAERFGLSVGEWRVMAVLGQRPGLSADAVGERTAMDKVAVSRAVARLAGLGHLTRRRCADDRRRSVLRLSAAGMRVYRQIVPLARRFEKRLLAELSSRDLAQLDRVMRKLSSAVARI